MYNILKIFASIVSIFAIHLRPSEITLAKDLGVDQEILSWHLINNDDALYKKAIFSKETKEAKAQREWRYWGDNADRITLPIKLDLLSKAADNLLAYTDLQAPISTLFNSIPDRLPKTVYAQKMINALAQTSTVQSNIQYWCDRITEQPTIQARITLKNQLLQSITNEKMRDHIKVLLAECFARQTINQLGLYTITDTHHSISHQRGDRWNPSGRNFNIWQVSKELKNAICEQKELQEEEISNFIISYLQDTTHDREILVMRNNSSISACCADRKKNIVIKECNIDDMKELNNFNDYYKRNHSLEGLFYNNKNFLIDSYVDHTNKKLYFLENNNSLIKLYAYNYQKNKLVQLDQLSYKIRKRGEGSFLENIPINNICEMKFLNNGQQIGIELSHAGSTENTFGGFSFAVYDIATQRCIIDTTKNRFACRYIKEKDNGFFCTSGDDDYSIMPLMKLVPATSDEVLLQDIIENGSFIFKQLANARSPTVLFLAQYKQLFLRCAHLKSHQTPIDDNEKIRILNNFKKSIIPTGTCGLFNYMIRNASGKDEEYYTYTSEYASILPEEYTTTNAKVGILVCQRLKQLESKWIESYLQELQKKVNPVSHETISKAIKYIEDGITEYSQQLASRGTFDIEVSKPIKNFSFFSYINRWPLFAWQKIMRFALLFW